MTNVNLNLSIAYQLALVSCSPPTPFSLLFSDVLILLYCNCLCPHVLELGASQLWHIVAVAHVCREV
jgi:hypothetical protein